MCGPVDVVEHKASIMNYSGIGIIPSFDRWEQDVDHDQPLAASLFHSAA